MKKRLLFFVFAYTVSICLLSAQLAKHSTDRWYAQHWMPKVQIRGAEDGHIEFPIGTNILTDKPIWVRPNGDVIPQKVDKLTASIDLNGRYLNLQGKVSNFSLDCLRVGPEAWTAKRCEKRISALEVELAKLEKERKALAVSTQ